MSEWWDRDQMGTPPAPQLIEKVEEQKVVLYDSTGKPLTWPPKRIGFKPPPSPKGARR